MARWLLNEPHYLAVVDTFWEQTEVDRTTGRQKKKKYPCPLHLDPKCAQDWNNKPGSAHVSRGGNSFDEGFITVCWADKGEPQDYVFVGDPTPGMEPIDDEAREVSSKFKWHDPTRFFEPGEGQMTFAEKMIMSMQEEAKESAKPNEEALALQKQMVDMMAMMAQTLAAIAKPTHVPASSDVRR